MNDYNGFNAAQRCAALAWLKKEYAAGRRSWPTRCDGCGQTEGIIEPHSEDYSQPFGDHIGSFGFCYRCHMMIHCRFKSPGPWDAYRTAIRAGLRAEPLATRNFGLIRRQLAGGRVDYVQCEPPKVPVLDRIHEARSGSLYRSPRGHTETTVKHVSGTQ